jgi:hypothetical protein
VCAAGEADSRRQIWLDDNLLAWNLFTLVVHKVNLITSNLMALSLLSALFSKCECLFVVAVARSVMCTEKKGDEFRGILYQNSTGRGQPFEKKRSSKMSHTIFSDRMHFYFSHLEQCFFSECDFEFSAEANDREH